MNSPCVAKMPSAAIAAVTFAIAFSWSVSRPLTHSDLWGHLAYGRHALEQGLSETEPLLPFSDGVAMTHGDWLWKTSAAWVAERAGVFGLLLIQAVPVAIAAAYLATAVWRTSQSIIGVVVALGAAVWMLQFHLIVRPQTAGLACFASLLLLRDVRSWGAVCLSTAVLFGFWVNLHGSWILGLLLLCGWTVGSVLNARLASDAVAKQAAWANTRRTGIAAVAAALGSLLNPEGPSVFVDTLALGTHPNVASFIEWKSLSETPRQRTAVFVCLTAWLAVGLAAVRAIDWRSWAVIGPLAAKTLSLSRMVAWLGPVLAYDLGRLGGRLLPGRVWLGRRTSRILVCVAMGAVVVSGVMMLRETRGVSLARPDSLVGVVDRSTPTESLQFLRDSDRRGVVWCDQDWGDAVCYFAPNVAPLVNSHGHLVKPTVWTIALGIPGSDEADGWLRELEIETVLTRTSRRAFITRLEEAGWATVHRDRRAVVLWRNAVSLSD